MTTRELIGKYSNPIIDLLIPEELLDAEIFHWEHAIIGNKPAVILCPGISKDVWIIHYTGENRFTRFDPHLTIQFIE